MEKRKNELRFYEFHGRLEKLSQLAHQLCLPIHGSILHTPDMLTY